MKINKLNLNGASKKSLEALSHSIERFQRENITTLSSETKSAFDSLNATIKIYIDTNQDYNTYVEKNIIGKCYKYVINSEEIYYYKATDVNYLGRLYGDLLSLSRGCNILYQEHDNLYELEDAIFELYYHEYPVSFNNFQEIPLEDYEKIIGDYKETLKKLYENN